MSAASQQECVYCVVCSSSPAVARADFVCVQGVWVESCAWVQGAPSGLQYMVGNKRHVRDDPLARKLVWLMVSTSLALLGLCCSTFINAADATVCAMCGYVFENFAFKLLHSLSLSSSLHLNSSTTRNAPSTTLCFVERK